MASLQLQQSSATPYSAIPASRDGVSMVECPPPSRTMLSHVEFRAWHRHKQRGPFATLAPIPPDVLTYGRFVVQDHAIRRLCRSHFTGQPLSAEMATSLNAAIFMKRLLPSLFVLPTPLPHRLVKTVTDALLGREGTDAPSLCTAEELEVLADEFVIETPNPDQSTTLCCVVAADLAHGVVVRAYPKTAASFVRRADEFRRSFPLLYQQLDLIAFCQHVQAIVRRGENSAPMEWAVENEPPLFSIDGEKPTAFHKRAVLSPQELAKYRETHRENGNGDITSIKQLQMLARKVYKTARRHDAFGLNSPEEAAAYTRKGGFLPTIAELAEVPIAIPERDKQLSNVFRFARPVAPCWWASSVHHTPSWRQFYRLINEAKQALQTVLKLDDIPQIDDAMAGDLASLGIAHERTPESNVLAVVARALRLLWSKHEFRICAREQAAHRFRLHRLCSVSTAPIVLDRDRAPVLASLFLDLLESPGCDQLQALLGVVAARTNNTMEATKRVVESTLAREHHHQLLKRVHRFTSIATGDAPREASRWDNATNTVGAFLALLKAVTHVYGTRLCDGDPLRHLLPVSRVGIQCAGVGFLSARCARLRASARELEVPKAMPTDVEGAGPEWAVEYLLRRCLACDARVSTLPKAYRVPVGVLAGL